MSIKPIHHGKIVKGRFLPDDPVAYYTVLSSLNDATVDVTIEKHRKARSKQQSNYYWGVIIKMIADHCGYLPEEAHDAMRMKFLQTSRMIGPQAGPVTVKSTTSLSTVEAEEYYSNIRIWASQFLGLFIPNPNECEVTP
jgi:hypothetical protein